MRVIAGTARSIPLKAPVGMETRPTTDRIKETLFNILQFELQQAVFVDICAGSGAIGIEALSRGAKRAVFIDQSKASIDVIGENLKKCRFTDRAKVVRADALRASSYIPKTDEDEKLIIFMDPPYSKGIGNAVVKELAKSGSLKDNSLIIVEDALNAEIGSFEEYGLCVSKIKEYKNQKHIFIRKA